MKISLLGPLLVMVTKRRRKDIFKAKDKKGDGFTRRE
jgi:hypothetical protein